MTDSCCSEGAESLAGAGQKRTLWIVLAINAVMFVGELIAGLLADSSALLADAADNLSDAVVREPDRGLSGPDPAGPSG